MPANRFRLLGFLLLLVVLNTQALTLGRLRGVALVGQALDVSVQVRIDPDESPASLCFEADVFHADTRQQPSRVQVSVEPTQIAQTVNLRVQSPGLVDEPVVTVYLRAGCAEKTSRRYVLLADVVSEQLAPDAPRLVPVPLIAPLPSAAGSGTANASSRSTAAALGKVGAATARAPVARRTGAARKPWPVARSKAATVGVSSRKPARPKAAAATPAQDAEKLQAGRTAGQSRLKLDPIEVLSDHPATPASSAASAPVDGAARDAREAQRVESLETSLKNLTALSSRNESSLADLKGRLQRVESERYLNPVVYGLFALLLASLAAVGFLLNQRRRQIGGTHANWWSGSTGAQPMRGPGETGHEPAQPSGFSPLAAPGALAARGTAVEPAQLTQAAAPRSIPGPITQVDVSLVEMSGSNFDRMMQSGTAHNAVRKQPRAQTAAAAGQRKSINSDELIDIRQQAEFFVSLGQTDQAVRVLENRISESGESSPLAYLDLLKIFHSLGLRADFRQVREDFSRLFNARVPEFSSFIEEGKGLEEYPDAILGITATWGAPSVFSTLEASLFRDQRNTPRELFDLAAFRDLLLLHAVALEEASASNGVAGPGRERGEPGRAHGGSRLPSSESGPELDIDLSDLHA